ncbi:hypothetical protein [Streptomyces sp. NPDC048172]|uniref:hypothetical protein n=1 Tax=Streptomyces sp. NPDC048172 TaxID=3365505 RepID=UPI0037171F17
MSLSPLRLQDRDRPDFERVLQQAMGSERVRTALARRGGAQPSLLRARARESADRIAAAAAEEYAAYTRARSAARRPSPAPRRGRRRSALPVLGVLVPSVTACAAVILLLLGGVLDATGSRAGLAASLGTAGWVCAAVAGVAVTAGVLAMFITAARNRAVHRPGVDRAREAWRSALLERGMLPFLTAELNASEPAE